MAGAIESKDIKLRFDRVLSRLQTSDIYVAISLPCCGHSVVTLWSLLVTPPSAALARTVRTLLVAPRPRRALAS